LKHLLTLERWLEKIEGFFLAASLIALLGLTLYAVAYRNLVAPFVLKMQASTVSPQVAPPAPAEIAPDPAAPAAGDSAASAPGGEAGSGSYMGDLGGEAPAPAPGNAYMGDLAGDAPAPAGGNAYMGDLADDAPAAKPAAAPKAAAGNAYMGDLADDAPAAEPAAAPKPAAGNAYMGDLADDAPAAEPAPATKPAGGNAYMGDLADDSAPPAPAGGNAYMGDLADDSEPAPGSTAGSYTGDLGETGSAAAPEAAAADFVPPPPAEDPPLLAVLKAFNFGWIDVVTRHLLLWVAFFGAAIAASRRKHIKIDALSRLLTDTWRGRLLILLDIVAVVACVFLTVASWHFLKSEAESQAMLYGPIPSWVGILIVPVGFGLLAWHFAFEAVAGLASACGYKSAELDERRSQQAGGEA
jgi:TRAP-type C4-dicarboxylate transport system permease small subunit